MEITGCDSVVFTFTRPRAVFARLLVAVVARWPGASVDDLDAPGSDPEPVAGFPVGRLPDGPGWLLFYRDAAMARHMKEAAYTPMADGDGPFAVITRVRRDIEFEASGLSELRASDHTPGSTRPRNPYRAWLCGPEVVEVTAVTPDDPDTQAFSAWVLAEVKRACSTPETGPGVAADSAGA